MEDEAEVPMDGENTEVQTESNSKELDNRSKLSLELRILYDLMKWQLDDIMTKKLSPLPKKLDTLLKDKKK